MFECACIRPLFNVYICVTFEFCCLSTQVDCFFLSLYFFRLTHCFFLQGLEYLKQHSADVRLVERELLSAAGRPVFAAPLAQLLELRCANTGKV